ncbi:MAG TPA: DNA-formamidopyrimidine glycosylase family protein [Solirubrobacteraceae bacterium]|nr:DNA-formamidopyrimidine glycosylase family protein [Solirubrobacteraceae bacterium]
MPEGDSIRWAANRIRPVLEGRVPEEIHTPHPRHALERWPERLAGRTVHSVEPYGKHLFLRFEGGLAIHSHLRMTGAWGVYPIGRRWRRSRHRAWLVLGAQGSDVVQFDGPVLELMTEGRTRFDQRLAALGPDVLADELDRERFLRRLRADDPTRGIGDALLDQTTIAGIGNMWKAEACWEAGVDPWRPVREVSDEEAVAIVELVRPRMQRSGELGPRVIERRIYDRAGQPCPRCGARVQARGQGDDNRTTFWCPACQR